MRTDAGKSATIFINLPDLEENMDNDTIRSYFEKGKKQGFSREFIRQTLLDKGNDYQQVNYVYNSFLTEEKEREFIQARQQASSGSWPKMLALIVGAVLLAGGVLFFAFSDGGVTGYAVKDAQAQLEDITKLNNEITAEKMALESQLQFLKQADLTIEQKNQIIQQQVQQLETLHQKMNQERDQIRQLLWELLNTIVARGQQIPQTTDAETE